MTAPDPLPARLVAAADKIQGGIVSFGRQTEGLLREAAARIDYLETKVDCMSDEMMSLYARLDELGESV